MFKVPYGQNPYSVIGKYIRDHITVIEDIIAVIEIDDITTNQLFMVDGDRNDGNYFIWNYDWYEGEKDVALIDFFPVREAINQSAQPEKMRGRWQEITESDCSGYDPVLAGYDDPVVGYVCSVCHEGYEKEVMGDVAWNYCPNCGADMRGEQDE